MVIRIAWRNIWRQPRRTILTVSTVSLGLALLLISLGLGDGSHMQMIDSAVRLGAGHLLIQAKGYQESGEVHLSISPADQEKVQAWLQSETAQPLIRVWLGRVRASGLASSSDGSTGVQIIGIEPRAESVASLFDEKIIEGSFLVEAGSDLAVIGEGIAKKLALKPGDKMVLMVQGAANQEIQSRLVRIGGILRTGIEELDQVLTLLGIATAQSFLQLSGGVHQIALFLQSEARARELAEQARPELPELQVLPWDEALPELRDYIRVDDGGNYVFNLLIFLLIAFTVMNTLLMSVLERRREFVLLDALGLTPIRRFLMVMAEAVFLSLLSVALGVGLGYAGHLYFHVYGLSLETFYEGDISAAGVVLDPILYSDLTAGRVVGSMLLVLGLTLLLAFLPAIRAARAKDVHLLGSN